MSVDLGEPSFDPKALPFTAPERRDRYRSQLPDQSVEFGAVSMGNPHIVIPVDSVERAPVGMLGPVLERHPSFPQRVNVGFMQRVDERHIRLRVFERGVGRDARVRHGRRAAVAVGRLWGELADEVEVSLPGGKLDGELAWTGVDPVANWADERGVRGTNRSMSQQKSGAATTHGEEFPESAIADYLKSHPDFFERHPLILLGLKLPHRTGGSAVSLVERQVSMLRQRNAQLERQFKDLVAVAKANDALVEKIHQLGLKLMRAQDVPARLEGLETGLREDFGALARGARVVRRQSAGRRAARRLRAPAIRGRRRCEAVRRVLARREAALRPVARSAEVHLRA